MIDLIDGPDRYSINLSIDDGVLHLLAPGDILNPDLSSSYDFSDPDFFGKVVSGIILCI